MAAKKKKKTKYARSSKRDVESEMRRYKKGTAKSGRGGKGGKVNADPFMLHLYAVLARKSGGLYRSELAPRWQQRRPRVLLEGRDLERCRTNLGDVGAKRTLSSVTLHRRLYRTRPN
jgi:hypothetical protein